jgi:acyl-CoA hydrolase
MTITCTPEEAISFIRRVDRIGFGLGPANPDAFLTALGTRDDWVDLVLGGALLLNYYDVLTHHGVSYRCGFFGPAERILLSQGHRIEHVPGGFRQFAPILAKFAPRVMVAQATPPDGRGTVNLSLHYGATRPELLWAGRDPNRLLLVEINPNLPRTKTLSPEFDNTIPVDVIDVLVEADGIPFRATLQTGIGTIPNIVATGLASGPLGGFGIHSEMFTSGLMRLHQAGKVTNSEKGIFPAVSVTTFALGTAPLVACMLGVVLTLTVMAAYFCNSRCGCAQPPQMFQHSWPANLPPREPRGGRWRGQARAGGGLWAAFELVSGRLEVGHGEKMSEHDSLCGEPLRASRLPVDDADGMTHCGALRAEILS